MTDETATVSTEGVCKFNLSPTETSSTFALPDGRKLGYAQYGSVTDKPIFYLHGFPGARIEAALWDEQAKKLNARIIAVDRPGFGWSSPYLGRRILDHARDVERLAEGLKIERFGVMGASGGGPYVLACAATIPTTKLKGVANICGLGLSDMSRAGMDWPHWAGFGWGWRYFPYLSRWYMSRQAGARLDLSDEERFRMLKAEFHKHHGDHEKDFQIFGDDDFTRLSVAASKEAFRQGLDGMMHDGQVVCQPPGFKVQDIPKSLPMQLWYGKMDKSVGRVGEVIKQRLKDHDKVTLHLEDETHASILVLNRERILKELLESMES